MPPSLSELKVIPSFCFAFKIPDDVTATNEYLYTYESNLYIKISNSSKYGRFWKKDGLVI